MRMKTRKLVVFRRVQSKPQSQLDLNKQNSHKYTSLVIIRRKTNPFEKLIKGVTPLESLRSESEVKTGSNRAVRASMTRRYLTSNWMSGLFKAEALLSTRGRH